MKVFQILSGVCYYDATPMHPTLESTLGCYTPDIVFVEAPAYVFEGWGYDETKTGDARFTQPIPPDGWRYDPETGQFLEINPIINTDKTPEERITALETENKTLKAQLTASAENSQFIEDCIAEMAAVVYA